MVRNRWECESRVGKRVTIERVDNGYICEADDRYGDSSRVIFTDFQLLIAWITGLFGEPLPDVEGGAE